MSRRRASGPLAPGEIVDRYEVLLEIARGGMGVVYAVRRPNLERFGKLLALKTLHENFASDANVVNMFIDEARIASHVHHPNVVQVLDVSDHDGVPYLVMELLAGRSLSRTLERARELGRELPLGFRYQVLAQVALGLDAAHSAKSAEGTPLEIVHRDVTPHNIHIGYSGVAKLIDFGIAAARDRLAGTRTGELKGTLAYLSPEQVTLSRSITTSADVWALGVVAWEVLASQRLFRAATDAATLLAVMNKPVPDLRSLDLDVPDEVARLIATCTSRDPEARPGNCREIAECFAAAAARENFGVPDVARVMEELFGVERERDESALAEAQQRPVSELSIAPVSNAAPPARARQRAVWAIAGVAIAAGALWVALTQLDRASQTPPSEPLTEARLEAPAALAQPAPQPRPTAQASAPSLASDVADAGRPATSAGAARRTPRAAVKPSRPATPASPLLASPYKRQP